tara:strand:+ start:85 stop:240 length:156 start_codon:yes stop_codon:yes gene_type:complete
MQIFRILKDFKTLARIMLSIDYLINRLSFSKKKSMADKLLDLIEVNNEKDF